MEHGIGMLLAGFGSGAAVGWSAALLHIRARYGDPENLKRERILYRGPLHKADLSVDSGPGK
jgi:hypothetical protein